MFPKTILLFLVFACATFAQTIVVVDSVTNSPIPNVRVHNQSKTVYTDKSGKFDISFFNSTDSLVFTHLSYAEKKLPFQSVVEKKKILLVPCDISLSEIKIIEGKNSRKQVGITERVRITPAEMQRVFYATDLLQKKTSLLIKDYGGAGLKTVSARGMTPENTIVLFNEAKVNNLGTGMFDFSTLASNEIEEMIYQKNGSDGFISSGGVLKIFSGNFRKEKFLTLGTGINSTKGKNFFAKLGNATNDFYYGFNLNRAYSPNTYKFIFEGKERQRENAFFSKTFLSANFGLIKKGIFFRTYVHYSHLLNGLPGFVVSNNYASSKASSLNNSVLGIAELGKNLSHGVFWKSTASFHLQTLKLNDLAGSLFARAGSKTSHFKNFSWLNRLEWKRKHLGFSLAYLFDYGNVDSLIFSFRAQREASQLFRRENLLLSSLTYEITPFFCFKKVLLNATANYKNISENALTGKNYESFSYSFTILFNPYFTSGTELIFSFGESDRYPTFNERYYSSLFGNDELKSERYKNFQATLRQRIAFLRFEASYFYILGTNKIIWVPTRLALQIPRNVASVKSQGLELTLHGKILEKLLNTDFGFFLTDAKNFSAHKVSDKTYGKQLIYVPRIRWNLNFYGRYKHVGYSTSFYYSGKTYFTPDNSEFNSLEDYLIWDVSFFFEFNLYNISNRFTVNIYNVLNENYFVIQSYPMPLRTFSINYLMRFK